MDVRNRPITVAAEHKPEFRLDIAIVEENETLSGDFILNGWNGTEWENRPMTGATALSSDSLSVIEWQLPKATLGYPPAIWVGVVSVGRGRNDSAADILGTEPTPLNWAEPVTLSRFVPYEAAAP